MKKSVWSVILAVILMAAVFILPILNHGKIEMTENTENVRRVSSILDHDKKVDNTKPSKVTIPKTDATVTFIVTVKGDSLGQVVLNKKDRYKNVNELIMSDECRKYTDTIKKNQAVVKATIEKMISGSSFAQSYSYNTVINGFTVSAPYSSMEKIRDITNVISVNPVFSSELLISENEPEDDETESQTDESSDDEESSEEVSQISGEGSESSESSEAEESQQEESESDLLPFQEMTGIEQAHKAGFTGGGRAIAVIDDSFDIGDPLFGYEPSVRKYSQEDIKTVYNKTIKEAGRKAEVYHSDKIIFAYDYAEKDGDTLSPYSCHGTKCAAAAAGYGINGEDEYKGMAYDAQLMLMKVCRDGTNYSADDTLLAALDDVAKLSPDVLNISMGVYGTTTNSGILDSAYDLIAQTGTMIVSAAGNGAENVIEHDKEGISAEYTDYGTITYPSYLSSVLSAASCDSLSSRYKYLKTDSDEKIPYCDAVSPSDEEPNRFTWEMDGTEYLYLDNYGLLDDYKTIDIKGKIAVVKRGEISLHEKLSYAFIKGAAGLIMISDEPLYIRFSVEESFIPCAVVGADSLQYFADNPVGLFEFCDAENFPCSTAGEPSAFASYGVTGDLRLKPDISAPGTEISLPLNSEDNSLTGSSASCALISGAAAVLSQYVDGSFSFGSDDERNSIIRALMMNTAEPALYGDKLYFTPRHQGAGIVKIDRAISVGTYVTDLQGNASVSMGDSEDGTYSFDLRIHNISDKAQTYKPELYLQSDRLNSANGKLYNTLTPENIIENADIVFLYDDKQIDSIEIGVGEEVIVHCDITLSPSLVMYYQTNAENGIYVDGYVSFMPEKDGIALSIPFAGYCGSWENAELFDKSAYQNVKSCAVGENSLYACVVDDNDCRSAELGMNVFTGIKNEETISIGRNTIKNIYDISSTSVPFIIPNFYLLRNAADYTIMINDSNNNTIFSRNLGTVSSYAGGNEPYADLISTFNTDDLSNLFAGLSDGEYTYIVKASTIPYKDKNGIEQSVSYKFTVDNTVPSKPETEIFSRYGHSYLRLTASDKCGISGFILYAAGITNNTLSYSDRIDELQESGYISADACKLVSTSFSKEKTEFVYDITELYLSLNGLKEYAKDKNIGIPVAEKIYVKCVDNAFNLSDPVQCGTTVPGTMTYKFVDNKGRAVEDVEMELDGKIQTSDKNGILTFENIVPNVYSSKITHLPDDYEAKDMLYLVEISNNSYLHHKTITLKYTGEELSGEGISDASETSQALVSEDEEEQTVEQPSFDNDNSEFALVFIGAMLIFTSVSLVLSRRKTRGGSKPVSLCPKRSYSNQQNENGENDEKDQ